MTTPQPKRREQRRAHLDASTVPVERALLHRAGELEDGINGAANLAEVIRVAVASELRHLAEELRWW